MKGLVIIPTYNEKENIEALIRTIKEIKSDLDVLVVDDNSPDKTWEIVENLKKEIPGIHLIKREKKLGLGTAYIRGFKFALEKSYDYIIQMDADFSHDPHDIPRFLELIKFCDLVIGSRYTKGISVVNWPIKRLLLSYFANKYASLVTGVPIRDLTSGFKCLRKETIEKIGINNITSDGYAFQIEVTTKAYYKKLKIIEIPIIFVERREGKSKLNRKIIWEAFWLVWKLKLLKISGKI